MHDEELVAGCLSGSKRHFDLLYDKFSYGLYGICLRYSGDSDEAKDILQEGFIKVFTNLKSYNSAKGNFEGWLKRIFVNTSIDYYRKKSGGPKTIDADNVGNLISEDDDEPIHDFSQEQLMEMIRELPPGYRAVFNMFVVDELSHKEIAAALGISESTSKSQFFKARKMLQEKIKSMMLTNHRST